MKRKRPRGRGREGGGGASQYAAHQNEKKPPNNKPLEATPTKKGMVRSCRPPPSRHDPLLASRHGDVADPRPLRLVISLALSISPAHRWREEGRY